MKTATGRFVALGTAATLALMTAPLAASASEGGTITFSGAIVAPQLEVSAAPGARVGTMGALQGLQGSAVTLTFSGPPGVTAGADVALQVNGGASSGDSMVTRFVERGGRLAPATRDGHYKVGRDGGVMSLSPKNATPDTRVTVVMSYD
ncbi:hypothetical protein [Paraburkholderia sp. BL21I4N1]|uniref:hypothetical protein n=1 Tax=Paraburkholderia sp. BL21I4N1 TaxID=1938801 RepID=UPI000CFBC824|nr:hypothetical protein [Paraburkholderia sp. BL21I4N1]PQV53116.1 hypothetical protein B0G83_102200 [Paraburkholderia sp. BL21I4N1]